MTRGSDSAPQVPSGHTPGDDSQCSPKHENSQFDIKQVSGSFALSLSHLHQKEVISITITTLF